MEDAICQTAKDQSRHFGCIFIYLFLTDIEALQETLLASSYEQLTTLLHKFKNSLHQQLNVMNLLLWIGIAEMLNSYIHSTVEWYSNFEMIGFIKSPL